MPPRLWLSGRCFECRVERTEPAAGGWIVKTTARRFFRFDASSHALLRRIMAAEPRALEAPARAADAAFLTDRLLPLGIYLPVGTDAAASARPDRQGATMRWHRQLLAASRVRPLAAALASLMSPWPLLALAVATLWLHAAFVLQAAAPVGYRDLVTCSPDELLLLAAVAIARGVLHELGHAAACWRLTRSVGAIGFGVFAITPVLYCDVSDVHLLPRREKALVGLAGPAMDVVFLALLAALAGPSLAAAKVYWLSVVAVALNLLPFYRNDGFWILNDLAGSDDLVDESFRACLAGRGRLRHWAMLIFTVACAGAVLAMAIAFAVEFGPQQAVEAARLLPTLPGAALALVTSLQYLALAFGVVAGVRALRQAARWHREKRRVAAPAVSRSSRARPPSRSLP